MCGVIANSTKIRQIFHRIEEFRHLMLNILDIFYLLFSSISPVDSRTVIGDIIANKWASLANPQPASHLNSDQTVIIIHPSNRLRWVAAAFHADEKKLFPPVSGSLQT